MSPLPKGLHHNTNKLTCLQPSQPHTLNSPTPSPLTPPHFSPPQLSHLLTSHTLTPPQLSHLLTSHTPSTLPPPHLSHLLTSHTSSPLTPPHLSHPLTPSHPLTSPDLQLHLVRDLFHHLLTASGSGLVKQEPLEMKDEDTRQTSQALPPMGVNLITVQEELNHSPFNRFIIIRIQSSDSPNTATRRHAHMWTVYYDPYHLT